MPIRSFTDGHGVRWQVWSTHPSNPGTVSDELRDGWLTFDSGVERRRVAPIPNGWESFAPERLELACRVARPSRTSDPGGLVAIRDEDPGAVR